MNCRWFFPPFLFLGGECRMLEARCWVKIAEQFDPSPSSSLIISRIRPHQLISIFPFSFLPAGFYPHNGPTLGWACVVWCGQSYSVFSVSGRNIIHIIKSNITDWRIEMSFSSPLFASFILCSLWLKLFINYLIFLVWVCLLLFLIISPWNKCAASKTCFQMV